VQQPPDNPPPDEQLPVGDDRRSRAEGAQRRGSNSGERGGSSDRGGRGVPSPQGLRDLIDRGMIADGPRLRGRLSNLLREARGPDDPRIAQLHAEIERSARRARARAELAPKPAFNLDLPVLARREDITRAIAKHQVTVICGETGSGKTTQLPQICLDLGLGQRGMIGHTQPRRIAARAVAQRLADELGTALGPRGAVGYKVRFGDETSEATLIKLMTDGVLLAEMVHDRDLLAYDTIIIDEAHERSLNIDFLLGYLRRLLPRRPDLKVIITSATIDPLRLSDHFGGPSVCPVVEVSGRTFPVEVRYTAVEEVEADDFETNEERAVLDAIDALTRPGMPRGDILVFLPGEREIRLTGEYLRKQLPAIFGHGEYEIVPLYARLSPQDQQKVFSPSRGVRVVLSTNVAETSLTVPGIRYVIDSGLARMSRYSHRTKVQRLPIEPISRASAAQRAGRCGRVAEGVCYRLYSQQDFDARPAFTDPEILRTNLASVILQMKALRLGAVEDFPFVEPPDARMVRDGYDTLLELGAVDDAGELTTIGQQLARLPADPRIARMLLAAQEHGALDEVLAIASALSAQDPRDRPMDKQQAADQAHAQFKAEGSDFLGLLNIWEAYRAAREELSHSRLRGWCRERFLSFNRVREWEETFNQLRQVAQELELKSGVVHRDDKGRAMGASGDAVHKSLLPGLLSSVLSKDEASQQGEFYGARGLKANIFPGSVLFKKTAKWVVCAELVQTTRLYARTCAKIDPAWLEAAGAHVLKRSHTDVHFVAETGQVCAWERVTLFGLVLVPRRRVPYGPINMKEAREVFVHDGLVNGQYEADLPFMRHNEGVLAEARELEAKLRRTDIWAEINARYDFFDRHLPQDVWNKSTFEHWYRALVKLEPDVLKMRVDDVLRPGVDHDPEHFPPQLPLGTASASIDYRLSPGKEEDGLTLSVPVENLAQLDPRRLEWLVPGLLREKVLALLKTLPKHLRVQFVGTRSSVTNQNSAGQNSGQNSGQNLGQSAVQGANQIANQGAAMVQPTGEDAGGGLTRLADECAALMTFAGGSLPAALSEAVDALRGVHVPPEAWQLTGIPDHLRFNVRVLDEQGQRLGESRDVEELRKRFAGRARKALAGMARQEFGREGIKAWDFGDLPERFETTRAGGVVVGYPTLVDAGESVTLTLAESAAQAQRQLRRGLIRLFALHCKDELTHRLRTLPGADEMFRHYGPLGDAKDLKHNLMDLICEKTFLHTLPPIVSKDDFDARLMAQWGRLGQYTKEVGDLVSRVLAARQKVAHRLGSGTPRTWELSLQDIREHAAYLLPPGVFGHLPLDRLVHYPRYAEALHKRLEKMREDGTSRESRLLPDVQTAWKRLTAWIAAAHAQAKRHAEEDAATVINNAPTPAANATGKPKSSLPTSIGKRSKVVIATDAAGWFMQALGEGQVPQEVEHYRWLLEEFRVSSFAQELGTAVPASVKRLEEAWAKVRG